MIPIDFSEEDRNELLLAKRLLENPGVAIRITNLLGTPIEKGLDRLPKSLNKSIAGITHKALAKAADIAIWSMKDIPGIRTSSHLHKLGAALSGGIGGLFGMTAIAAELPISTTIILRSIADIARSQGESINEADTKLACLEVFALGGNKKSDDSAESGYYLVRAALARQVSEASKFLQTGVAKKGAPVIARFVAKVAERFGIQVTEKVAAQAVPIIGALGGAAVNTVFIDHFQDMAKGHFIVRKLERKYGRFLVQQTYESLH